MAAAHNRIVSVASTTTTQQEDNNSNPQTIITHPSESEPQSSHSPSDSVSTATIGSPSPLQQQHTFSSATAVTTSSEKESYPQEKATGDNKLQPNAAATATSSLAPSSKSNSESVSVPIDQQDAPSPPSSTPTPATTPAKPSWKAKAWDIWMKNWFLLGLVVVIILARYFPGWGRTGGPIRPEYSVKYGITSCIFLLSGLSLKTRDLLVSAMNYRAHLMVQITSFIIIPLFVKAITSLLGLTSLNAKLLAGMAVTSATPTTISSNVVMTANSNGNESLALFNAAFGNLLGVFISPLIVLILLHSTPETPSGQHGLDYATILRDLGTTILVPIVVGQIYLYYFPKSIAWAKSKVHFPTLNSTCLLILVWTVFCDAFNNNTFSSVSAGEIIAIGALQGVIFWIMTLFLGLLARSRPAKLRILKIMDRQQQESLRQEAHLEDQTVSNLQTSASSADSTHPNVTRGLSLPRNKIQAFLEPMSKEDTVAILFCGGTKSVAMGIPMIKILYSSSAGSQLAGLLATPLLIYHVEQLFSGAFMVGWLKKWVGCGEETLESFEKQPKASKKQHQDDEIVDAGAGTVEAKGEGVNINQTSPSLSSNSTALP
ncbi:MAG: SBF-like CPA transporter family-domain-containing protein [Linnemannia elongata]|nr:MAG: SBF-like CPA transporter family-domain-containing protein [Linnemannia elongata]